MGATNPNQKYEIPQVKQYNIMQTSYFQNSRSSDKYTIPYSSSKVESFNYKPNRLIL